MNGCSPRIIYRNIEINFSCASKKEGVHPLASLREDDFASGKKCLRKFLLVVAPLVTYCFKICMFALVSCLGITNCIFSLAVLSRNSSRVKPSRDTPCPSCNVLTDAANSGGLRMESG